MGKLVDIKETDLGVPSVMEYTLSRAKGAIGEDFSVVVPGVNTDYSPGNYISVKGINGMVTSREFRVGEGGRQTVFSGVSKIGEMIQRSPLKTLMYMSMTADEISEFKVTTGEDYDSLDYIPLIKECRPDDGLGGWTCHDVINDLTEKAGLTVVVNTYNYWLKQVQASSGSSYFETILSTVNFLRPIVYSDEDDVIYIIERPLMGGTIDIPKSMSLTERLLFNFESRTLHFYVEGGYGKWDRNKSKIEAEPEREAVLESETYQEKPMLLRTNYWGGKQITHKNNTGSVETVKDYKGNSIVFQPGEEKTYQTPDSTITWKIEGREGTETKNTISLGRWLKEPMRERYTTTEIWRLDPFGNFKCLISKHTVGFNETLNGNVLDSLEEYTYDFLTEEYDKPRLKQKTTTIGRYSWMVTEFVGLTYRYFKAKTEEVSESWVYSSSGLLLQEILTRTMDVVRLWDGNEYVELDLADSQWTIEGGETLNVVRATVEEVVTDYRQISPDYYQKSTTRRRLGALARKVGEENYSVVTDMIRGKVPRTPMHYRQTVIWAGDTFDADSIESQNVPTMMLSNPNIIDWQDAEAILSRLKQFAAEANMTERTIEVPMDIPIDVGWQIGLAEVGLAGGESVPAVPVVNYSVVSSWNKSVKSSPPSAVTTIVIEGR